MSIEPKTEAVQQVVSFSAPTTGEAYAKAAQWLTENDPEDTFGEDVDFTSPVWNDQSQEWTVLLYAQARACTRLEDLLQAHVEKEQALHRVGQLEEDLEQAQHQNDVQEEVIEEIRQAIDADEDEATAGAVRQLAEAHQAAVDQAEDHWHTIELLADKLGVPYEPHQSFADRLLEAAGGEGQGERLNGILQRAQSAEINRLRNRLAELEDRAGEARYYRAALETAHQLMAGALPEGSPLMEAWRTLDKALEGTWMCGLEEARKRGRPAPDGESPCPDWQTKPFRRKGGGHV
ncbi:MAG: hypothetical protein ACLFQ3_09660 [Thiohalorhabdus sp.]